MIEIDDKFNYQTPKYDSIEYDFFKFVNNDFLTTNDIYNYILLTKYNISNKLLADYSIYRKEEENIKKIFFSQFSSKINKLPGIRSADSAFFENVKKGNDIIELDSIINELSFFEDFSFNNKVQIDVLKKLIIYTQILPLTINDYNYKFLNNQLQVFNNKNVFEIKTYKDFKVFKSYLDYSDDSFFKIKCFYDGIWIRENQKYLSNISSSIEKDYKNENVFYFYTLYDLKVLRFEIIYENNIFTIKKEHLNPQFLMFSSYPERPFVDEYPKMIFENDLW